jgi:ligand-binding SRPBCC domain-containing protein
LKKGAVIDYQLTLRGIPVKWRTEITKWNPPFEFVDTQIRGPYKQWIHRHTFTELDANRTLVADEVRYRLPFEPLGDIFNFLIGRDLKKVFDYREKTVSDLLR